MNNDVLFSSANDAWATPQGFYNLLNEEFNFTLDPCATAENAKCNRFYTAEDDGLAQFWDGETVYVNPPYSHIKAWAEKCVIATLTWEKFATVVLLIPSRTDTQYWHRWVMRAAEVRFVKGRLIFGTDEYWAWLWEQPTIERGGKPKPNSLYHKYGKRNSAPFPSAVAVFRSGHTGNPVMSAMERE